MFLFIGKKNAAFSFQYLFVTLIGSSFSALIRILASAVKDAFFYPGNCRKPVQFQF